MCPEVIARTPGGQVIYCVANNLTSLGPELMKVPGVWFQVSAQPLAAEGTSLIEEETSVCRSFKQG